MTTVNLFGRGGFSVGGISIVDAVNDINGSIGMQVAKELQLVAETRVVPESKAALMEVKSIPVRDEKTGHLRWPENTSEFNIPYMRSGNLALSITANPTTVDEFGLVAFVSADVTKAGYARNLLTGDNKQKKEWKFLPERPYYTYTGVSPI